MLHLELETIFSRSATMFGSDSNRPERCDAKVSESGLRLLPLLPSAFRRDEPVGIALDANNLQASPGRYIIFGWPTWGRYRWAAKSLKGIGCSARWRSRILEV
jgi:hypothetical protein